MSKVKSPAEAGKKLFELEDRLTALETSAMQLFRFLLDRPAGVILTADTDMMLAQLLEQEGLVMLQPGGKVIIPKVIVRDYRQIWTGKLEERHQKRNWMYRCLEAAMYLYGVMSYDALKDLFSLRYPDAGMDEVKELFDSTPAAYQWFTEREDRLVLNGYEKDDYYKKLENEYQAGLSYYVPKAGEVDELYEQGSLISRESHSRLRDFIAETFGCDEGTAALKVHELYEAVNNHVRVGDAAEAFARSDERFSFPSDETEYRFMEAYIEMTRECRIRDNRGHDYYEMLALNALKSGSMQADGAKQTAVRRLTPKVGRNDPCPCGSGKKYKNCCG